jgi:hypothetical protein
MRGEAQIIETVTTDDRSNLLHDETSTCSRGSKYRLSKHNGDHRMAFQQLRMQSGTPQGCLPVRDAPAGAGAIAFAGLSSPGLASP